MDSMLNLPTTSPAQSKRALLAEHLRKTAAEPLRAPLSFAQERLWFLEQLEPDTPLYNLPTLTRLHGNLDVPALEKAIQSIVKRHESLHTRFVADDDEPSQIVDRSIEFRLRHNDFSRVPADEKERMAAQIVQEEVSRPFNLGTEPLIRGMLIRLEESEHL